MGWGRGTRGPAAAGPQCLHTAARWPRPLPSLPVSAVAAAAPPRPDLPVAPPAFPSNPAGVSAASLANFVAARPSTATVFDGQCGHHAEALPTLAGPAERPFRPLGAR